MILSCRLAGKSVSIMPVAEGWKEKEELYIPSKISLICPLFKHFFYCANSLCWGVYPVDLDVVQLLLPLHDVLHAVHPDVDVPHQH